MLEDVDIPSGTKDKRHVTWLHCVFFSAVQLRKLCYVRDMSLIWELCVYVAFVLIGKREWESVCTLAHSSRSLQLFSIFICSHLPHGGCPGFSENTSHAEAAWTEDSDLGSGWLWLRKCLWEVIQLLVKTGSRFLVLLQCSRDVTLHRDTLQQATAPELELLGLGSLGSFCLSHGQKESCEPQVFPEHGTLELGTYASVETVSWPLVEGRYVQ